jgi:hypothetical protein
LPVKGIDHPVRAWRVDALRRTDGRFEAAREGLPLTNMVGREEDVAQLLRAWREAREGEGRVVVIDGAAGIGKSRLTQALRERLAGEPVTVLRYQCSPFHVNAASHPVIGQLEHASTWTREDTPEQKLDKLEAVLAGNPAQVAKAVPLFAALLSLPTGERYPPLEVSPQKRKEMLLEALADQVVELSKRQPVLIIFEDVHWIDPTSQQALDLLVPRLQALSVLLIVTYRPEPRYPRAVVGAACQEAGGPPDAARRGGIGEPGDLGRSLPAEVLEKIVSHAEGVPLCIRGADQIGAGVGPAARGWDQYALQSPLPDAHSELAGKTAAGASGPLGTGEGRIAR